MHDQIFPVKANPTIYPRAVTIAPIIRVYIPDLKAFNPIIMAFAIPKLNNSMTPIIITGINWEAFDFDIPQAIKYGIAGKAPKTTKEIKVATPHLRAIIGSIVTSPSYSSIIILTKACSFVEMRSAILAQSSIENPFSV